MNLEGSRENSWQNQENCFKYSNLHARTIFHFLYSSEIHTDYLMVMKKPYRRKIKKKQTQRTDNSQTQAKKLQKESYKNGKKGECKKVQRKLR